VAEVVTKQVLLHTGDRVAPHHGHAAAAVGTALLQTRNDTDAGAQVLEPELDMVPSKPAPMGPHSHHHIRGLGAGELGSLDLQAASLALAAGDPFHGLAEPRNIHSPLTKVSRLLLLDSADPDLAVEEGGEAVPLIVLHQTTGHQTTG